MITTFTSNFETTLNLAQKIVVAHGETFELLAYLFDNGISVDLTGYDLQLLYQDVCNLSAYYTIDGTVDETGAAKIVWTAANDVGAKAYRFHLKATKDGEVSYPARWEVGMYSTPDFTASHLDPYVKYIDFDQYELLNAPWALLSDFNILSNEMSAKADTSDLELTLDTPNWTLSPSTYQDSPITLQWTDSGWVPYADGNIIGAAIGGKGSVELRWIGNWAGSGTVLSATRQNPYAILGNQTSVELALKDHGHTADEVGAVALTAVGQVYNGSDIGPYQGLRIDDGKLVAVAGNGVTITGEVIELDQDTQIKLSEAHDAYTGLSNKVDLSTLDGFVPTSRTINDQQLTGDIDLSATQITVGGNSIYALASVEGVLVDLVDLINDLEADIPTKTSDLDNDSGFITNQSLTGYVPKSTTVNGQQLSGNIELSSNQIKVGGEQPWAAAPVDVMIADIITYQIPTVEAKIPAVSAETWTFTLEGGTTLTKRVAVY